VSARPASVSPRTAITLFFTLNGVMLGSWGARIPAIQDRLDVGPGELAIALACLAGGALIAMPAAGRVIAARGSAVVLRFALVTLGALLVLPGVMPTLALTAGATFLVGVSNGAFDVAQNAQGVEVERRANRAIFSSMHAAFSFGGLIGAGLGAAAAALDVSAGANFAIVGVAAILIGGAVSGALIPDGPPVASAHDAHDDPAAAAAARRAHVWPLRALAFCALFCEGAAMDWSAVHLRDIGATTAVAALGYGAFSVAMAAGRLRGDALVERLGPVTLARRGGLIAGGAMAVALIAEIPAVGLLAYVAIGSGLSVIIPLIFRAAASTGADAGPALAGVTTTGYLGLLSGPPIIGAVASVTSVPGALVLVVVSAAAVAIGASSLRTPTPVHA
jgi:MFS transporter